MGMYTGLRLRADLKLESESEWLPVIKIMLGEEEPEGFPNNIKHHELFDTRRWSWMLRGTSAYLEPDFLPNSSLTYKNNLFAQFNIKNYDQEIQKFLDWVSPYIYNLYCCSTRYEEDDEETIYALVDGKLNKLELT